MIVDSKGNLFEDRRKKNSDRRANSSKADLENDKRKGTDRRKASNKILNK